jgi:hypothetical protein
MAQKEIPRSIIRGSGFYNIELGEELMNKGGKVLLINKDVVLIGLGDIPYILWATPYFDIESLPSEGLNRLPANIKETLYEVEEIFIKSSLASDNKLRKKWGYGKYPPIPTWVNNYQKLRRLHLENIILNNLGILKDLPIEEIELQDTKFDKQFDLTAILEGFKSLKRIVCDDTLPRKLKNQIRELNIGVKELTRDE